MAYVLGKRSLENLTGVDLNLQRVVKKAIQITTQDFTVIEGLRTRTRQAQLVKQGASKTMNSKHLTGDAVDVVPYPIPTDWNEYKKEQWDNIAKAMKAAAKELGVKIQWGGDWKTFIDKPHWELA